VPIYEYRCHDCRRRVSIFFRSVAAASAPQCPRCGGTNLERLFSRVVVRRGSARSGHEVADDAWDAGDDAGDVGESPFDLGDVPGLDDDADPREIARWTREMSASLGEPLDPELDQALADIERGADPEEVLDRVADADLDDPLDPEGD